MAATGSQCEGELGIVGKHTFCWKEHRNWTAMGIYYYFTIYESPDGFKVYRNANGWEKMGPPEYVGVRPTLSKAKALVDDNDCPSVAT
jgi:hypothetical protein